MVQAELDNMRKEFNDGQVIAVDDISLTIDEGELIVLVGPSGCGKSTTLRCIAGLESLTSGEIRFDGVDVTGLPPKDRRISMVFQNYALYPSMTVYENMAFGLKMRGVERKRIDEQVTWAANMMEIGDLLDRYPMELSGGQQQRVALGRAIVRDPTLFLLDEPLSNLDAKLRAVMRTEIQELQKELGVAAVFVTHDQEEAMTMGDRIVVMNAGRIEQVAEPEVIYHDPASIFVADFIGSPAINFFVADFDGESVGNETFSKELPEELQDALEAELNDEQLVVGIRPEHMYTTDAGEGLFDVDVEVIEPLGNTQIVYFEIDDERYNLVVPATADLDEGERVGVEFEWPHAHFFKPEGGKAAKWMNVVESAESIGFVHGDEGPDAVKTGDD
ncbi:MAG: ABC transporter ATP-binding protein [Haloferacaceae archaeon]